MALSNEARSPAFSWPAGSACRGIARKPATQAVHCSQRKKNEAGQASAACADTADINIRDVRYPGFRIFRSDNISIGLERCSKYPKQQINEIKGSQVKFYGLMSK